MPDIPETSIQTFINRFVDNDQWVVVSVPGASGIPATPGVPIGVQTGYAYTVGLTYLGLPELMVLGLGTENAKTLLEHCVSQALVEGPFPNGARVDGVVGLFRPGERYPVNPMTVINMHQVHKQQYTHQAYEQYGHWEYELQQLVIPDSGGFFPWESQYIGRRLDMLGVLGPVREPKLATKRKPQ